jgi:hypothetical protein
MSRHISELLHRLIFAGLVLQLHQCSKLGEAHLPTFAILNLYFLFSAQQFARKRLSAESSAASCGTSISTFINEHET